MTMIPRSQNNNRAKAHNAREGKEKTMLVRPVCVNNIDDRGRPAGGTVRGIGLSIDWQNGPLGRGAERIEPNGAFVESVIFAALQRIRS